jgi:hypothetical protein
MPAALRVVDGNWGAPAENVRAVAGSVVDCFERAHADEQILIALEATAGDPRTLNTKNETGEFVVQLNLGGLFWARLAYQFAHEFCHVLAGPLDWTQDLKSFSWLEETLCETASLFALRAMATSWLVRPPYPEWRDYSRWLESHAAERIADPVHCLPPDLTFGAWFAKERPRLEAEGCNREMNTIAAKELLPIFETNPTRWLAIRYFYKWERSPTVSLPKFLGGWIDTCSPNSRPAVESISASLGVTPER